MLKTKRCLKHLSMQESTKTTIKREAIGVTTRFDDKNEKQATLEKCHAIPQGDTNEPKEKQRTVGLTKRTLPNSSEQGLHSTIAGRTCSLAERHRRNRDSEGRRPSNH